MWYVSVITGHIVGALGALATGLLALLAFPNGTQRHRVVGKLYLVSWLLLASTGFVIGSWHSGITVFEVLNTLGFISTVYAYSFVFRRKQLGRIWLHGHYRWMVTSLTFVVIATINQVLPRMGIEYPLWVFYLMVAVPVPINVWIVRRLDRRYHLSPRAASNSPQAA